MQLKRLIMLFNELTVIDGVKQGTFLTAILFVIYKDELLQVMGVGCDMGYRFTGALAYVDDIALLTL